MFYIEKNDKPTWIEKIIPIIKVENNTIKLPYKENINQNKIEKLAQKTKKVLIIRLSQMKFLMIEN